MTQLLLSDDERRRFTEFLYREAASATAIAEQMETHAGSAGKVLAQRERRYAVAATIIADRLHATESFTVSGDTAKDGGNDPVEPTKATDQPLTT